MTGPQLHTDAPPFNRWGNRRGDAPGGPVPPRGAWVPPVNIETNVVRAPGDLNDTAISRERMPWLHSSYYAAPAHLVNWTLAGPARRSLHMRDVTIRTMAGTSNTRAQDPIAVTGGIQDGNGSIPAGIRQLNGAGIEVPVDKTPHGLHTRVRALTPGGAIRPSTRRALSTVQMRPGRQNRLSNSTGQGQSFSQTTIHQGAG
jgi:hypothetical protein